MEPPIKKKLVGGGGGGGEVVKTKDRSKVVLQLTIVQTDQYYGSL